MAEEHRTTPSDPEPRSRRNPADAQDTGGKITLDCGQMPRAASLKTVVALALCSSASSFVLPWSGRPSPAYNGPNSKATTAALSHPSAPRPLSAPEDATARIRSKRKRSSLHVRPASVTGGVVGGGEVAAEASGDASDFCVLSSEGSTGLEVLPVVSSSSAAPAKTEIPTDVAVVGAPQQVRLMYGPLAVRCVHAAGTAGGGVPCYMTTIIYRMCLDWVFFSFFHFHPQNILLLLLYCILE